MKSLLAVMLLSSTLAAAQQSTAFIFPRAGTVHPSQITEDWNPVVQNLEAPVPGGTGYWSHLQDIKQNLPTPTGIAVGGLRATLPAPQVLSAFDGNPFANSVPNDNDMAISNDGKVVSVINTTLRVYDASDGSMLFTSSLQAFSSALGIPNSKYDPRALYDPAADRFIIAFLNGFDDSTSFVILAFSQTNDPLGAWNLYALPGNPDTNGTWTDFPMLGLTAHEFFLTGNSIINDSSWQEGFLETLLWQVNKSDGYAGDSLRTRLWHDIQYNNRPIRNLCPAKGGSFPQGPDQYFVSNRNFDVTNDTFFLVHLSDTMNGNPVLTVQAIKADLEYGVPPVARQFNGHTFETNDGRMLAAFIENDKIHFAGNCRVPSTGNAGLYHGILSDPDGTPTIQGTIISDSLVDLGYPNIIYTGHPPIDEALIICDHTSPDTFAGMSAFFYREGELSERLSIKTGTSYVNILSGTYERWGDYTGAQRRYNDTGVVWVSGNYGKFVGGSGFQRQNATWIAEINAYGAFTAIEPRTTAEPAITTYPNPSADNVHVRFRATRAEVCHFTLYSLDGRLVKHLLTTKVKAGDNQFSFSTAPLPSGTYILSITSGTGIVASEVVHKG